MGIFTGFARFLGWAGLTAVGGLHLVWATGSPWPEKNQKRLSEAVIGSSKVAPADGATAVVAGAALVGGAVAGGALGDGKLVVGVRRFMGVGLLARATFGGEAALAVLDLPTPPGKRFLDLDGRVYRPLCAVLGVALLVGARRKPKHRGTPKES